MTHVNETQWRIFNAIRELVDLQDKINTFEGVIVRIAEFSEVLDDMNAKAAAAESVQGDGKLGFEDVDLLTPTGECLAKKINVSIDKDNPLMVTGRNAAGKTSFFRVLGGLWPAVNGRVVGERDSIFLVPQRVYSFAGSFQDQITYPKIIPPAERTAELNKELRHLLQLVGIEYLVDREKEELEIKQKGKDDQIAELRKEGEGSAEVQKKIGKLQEEKKALQEQVTKIDESLGSWDRELVWEDTLSLGEQQRMGMARLFYNRPRYGVLDECTSAVSVEVEEKLYTAARELDITAITISQRLALTEFHSQELRLGEATDAGWSLHAIENEEDGPVGG